jgi:hypothetical protein
MHENFIAAPAATEIQYSPIETCVEVADNV